MELFGRTISTILLNIPHLGELQSGNSLPNEFKFVDEYVSGERWARKIRAGFTCLHGERENI